MKATIKNGILTIEMPVSANPARSKQGTGPNLVIATTSGNCKTDCLVQGKPLVIGLNVYIPAGPVES